MGLKDRVALVTGGSSGIGKAISLALANEGCRVVFTFNSNEKGAEETLKLLGVEGAKFKADLTKEADIEGLLNFVKENFGKLDILVNNAGVEVLSENQLDVEAWKKTFELDLFSVVSLSNGAIELMRNGGSILNISSEYGDEKMGSVECVAYSSVKAAVNSFTRTLAKKLAPKINVNAISPGYVDTPMWTNTTEEQKKTLGKDQLIERFILPEEVADMAVSIVKNGAITGEVVVVDGGLSLKTI